MASSDNVKPETYIVEYGYSGGWFPQCVDIPAIESYRIALHLEAQGYPVMITKIGSRAPIYVTNGVNI